GVLTPTAIFDSVQLAGTSVQRAVLHNQDFINEKGVNVSDKIIVRKAGDIIPEIVRVSQKNTPTAFQIPLICPSCASEITPTEESALRCINPECPQQLTRNIIHFASRGAMDIDGLGESIVEQLADKKLIADVGDIYFLTHEKLLLLDGFKDKSAQNLMAAIENSKNANLDKLIFSFGIRNIGEKAARLLAEKFKSLETLINATVDSIIEIDGFGLIGAQSVVDYFKRDTVKYVIAKLRESGVNMVYRSSVISDIFSGKTIVVTGTLPTLSREKAEKLVVDNGGKAASSVSKKTGYVLAGEKAGSKLDKANQLGVTVINEQQFLDMLNN
ncbi:MAG: NAD-dependent DNA ligase LigA, partial [Oscillospiraceae bacterium]